MRAMAAAVVMLVGAGGLMAQTNPADGPTSKPSSGPAIKPDLKDVKYGPHERNVLDLYKAKSDKPTPLLVWIHGGGFSEGDKNASIRAVPVKELLDMGISVAAINYRYSRQARAPGPFLDSARALQFLRMNAKEYNLDPKRFGAMGNSAGAGMALWIAFHDDLADPKNADPVLRESTKLVCVYTTAGQTSYDPRYIKANIPGIGWSHSAMVALFDLKPGEQLNPPPEKAKIMEEYAAINHLKAGCPPVYMWYGRDRTAPADDDLGGSIHHPKFGDLLKEKMDTLKIECIVHLKSEPPTNPDHLGFLKKHLVDERK